MIPSLEKVNGEKNGVRKLFDSNLEIPNLVQIWTKSELCESRELW